MVKKIIDESTAGQRLDVFIQNELNISRKQAALFDALVNGVIKKPSYKLKIADCVQFSNVVNDLNSCIQPQNIPLDIKFEDKHLLVINKPKGMLTHPTAHSNENTLVNALMYHCGNNLSNKEEPQRRGIVHRLDKNTAGLILAAKTDEAALNLQKQIREKTAQRKYLAVALGYFSHSEGIIDKPLAHYIKDNVKMKVVPEGEGKDAITYYKVLEQFADAALVELELKTGRTHQIRAHLSSIGHPVFGDTLYGSKGHTAEYLRNIKTTQQVLQSYKLSFTHPKNNDIMNFELSPNEWDYDLGKVLNVLRRKK